MKAQDFNLPEKLVFNFDEGSTTFLDNRLVIFEANSIGMLRQNMIDEFGWEKTREFFLKFGYQNGYSDFMQLDIAYEFDTEMDLLASGPTIHTWEGIVNATPTAITFNRETGEFLFTGNWKNSYEAEQHLSFNDFSKEPVCWSLMGYASGWCSGFMKKPMLAIEPVCIGKGDDHCEWLIKPVKEWGAEAEPYIKALNVFWRID